MSDQGMKNLERVHLLKIHKRIEEIGQRFIWTNHTPVSDAAIAETREFLKPDEARKLNFKPVADGHFWGRDTRTGWFRLRFTIPRWFRNETVALHFQTGGECLIFREGAPVQALDYGRSEYILFKRAKGGEKVELLIEGVAGGSIEGWKTGKSAPMRAPHIAILNRCVQDAYWDLCSLADMVADPQHISFWNKSRLRSALPEDDTRRATIIFTLGRAVNLFDYGTPARQALETQAAAVRRILKPVLARKANSSAQTFACMGHSHIDVAWLWPLAETIRKCGRTFSNVLELMDNYPEFKFAQSQPHLFEFTRDNYPSLYRRMRAKIEKGQFMPVGCMWVEADCNITGGESLVRQVLFGTRFFKREFDRDAVCLWLPDVFGYSAATPQILKRSGINYFLTQKISWSQFTNFPHHSFRWEGIDGSRVLAHFLPTDNYNSDLHAPEMMMGERNYREKDRSPIQAILFGYGDGGGGPNRMMLERMRRYRNIEGMPKLVPMTPKEFFNRLDKDSIDLPSWIGELYLEFHRGTYTTQAWNKRNNRQSEIRLREAEILASLGMPLGGRYDQKSLNEAWKLVLLNQFHDILPGSSIGPVYKDSDRDYSKVFEIAANVRKQSLARLAAKVDTRGKGIPVLVFNPLSWERNCIAELSIKGMARSSNYTATAPDCPPEPAQVGHDGRVRFRATAPSMGHALFHLSSGEVSAPSVKASARGMENERLRVVFDRLGRVSRVFDKLAGRDVLQPGRPGNRFILYEDKTAVSESAWDIDIFYKEKPLETDGRLVSARVIERGPVRSVVRFKRAIGRSFITQDVILCAGSCRLDFETNVEWGDEKDVLLKVSFPVNVRSEKARYEIQFGSVERPTHWNRPEDFARFEVPAQKWADLSEGDYGVALLNDSKYGYDTFGNVISLSLLRAAKSPDVNADVNRTHSFTYSIFPHTGSFTNGVVRAGYELNMPAAVSVVKAGPGRLAPRSSAMAISGDNVIIETVKKAEDDDAVIVRLYEAHGCRGRRIFSCALPVRRVMEVDLMEREEKTLPSRNGRVAMDFRPFQIRTLKILLDTVR